MLHLCRLQCSPYSCAVETPRTIQFVDWPTDIWGVVFANLEPPYPEYSWHQPPSPATFKASEQVRKCKEYFGLRLVCRKFNQALASETDFLNYFYYYQADASLFMPKLLSYLKANRTIKWLSCASDASCLGMLLPQLLVSPGELKRISIGAVTAATVSCLSAYTGIVACFLYASSEESLNLQPIAALHKLQKLYLYGAQFHGLQLGDHLKTLFIGHGMVICEPDGTFLPGLLSLAAVGADITLPGIGLGACTALTRLEMQSGKITSADNGFDLYYVRQRLPESMSALFSLTNLTLLAHGQSVDMEQFGVLPALTRLHVMHDAVSSFAGDVAVLHKLQTLVISGSDSVANLEFSRAPRFDFDWMKLEELHTVQIKGAATFDRSILQVVKLPQLLQFQLVSFAPGDAVTAQCVAALPGLFAEHPEIDVVIQEMDD